MMNSHGHRIEALIAARLYGGPNGYGDRLTMVRVTPASVATPRHSEPVAAQIGRSARVGRVTAENRGATDQALDRGFWNEVVHLDPRQTRNGTSLRIRLHRA